MKNFSRLLLFIGALLGVWFYMKSQKPSHKKDEKVLNLATKMQIQTLDPAACGDGYGVCQICKVYEGLLEYHYLKRPHELIPNLAESMPTISGDGLVYTFKIKRGVKFHDNKCFKDGKGRELKAQDFVYSIMRVADPKLQSENYATIAGKIKGLDEWRAAYVDAENADCSKEVEGLKALDDYTIQFTLAKPSPQFLNILAMSLCFVVPKEAVDHYGKEFINHPVGTGPFVMDTFNSQESKIVFTKNPNFREKLFPSEAAEELKHLLVDAGKRLPLVDKVITHIITEEQPAWLKFQKGELDVLDMSTSNNVGSVIKSGELTTEMKDKGVGLSLSSSLHTGFWAINCMKEPFVNNIALRQALSTAFDRQEYSKMFYNGTALPAQSIIPPGLDGYRANYVNPNNTYNLERAKNLLAKAGFPGGKGLPEITLDVASNTDARQKGEFFQKCMQKIGVNIKVITNSFPELSNKNQQRRTMIHAVAWCADYPDAENFLILLHKSNELNQGISGAYKNPKYNQLFDKASVMQPSPERTAIYEQLNEMVANDVPVICVEHRAHPELYQGWISNFVWSDFLQYGNSQYINIDLEKKSELMKKLK